MKLRTLTVTALAALAVAAPATQAQTLGNDAGSSSSAASHYTAAALKAMGQRYQAMANAYDEQQSTILGSGNPVPTYPSAVRPDNRAGVRGVVDTPSTSPAPVATPVAAQPDDNFSWGDAGLGAGASLLIVAALIGSARLTRDAQRSLRAH